MKKLCLLAAIFLSLHGLSQPFIQGSIQKGTAGNETDILLKSNYTSAPGEFIQYLSISVAIPTASAVGVTNPVITGVGNLNGVLFTKATPFIYTSGTETIYSWLCNNLTIQSMSWTNGIAFKVATIVFTGGTACSKVRLVDFSNAFGGNNGNTYFSVVTNAPPFDMTNFSDPFFAIPDPNGSTKGTYPNADKYVETNSLICLTNIACQPPSVPVITNIGITTANVNWNAVSGAAGYEYQVTTGSSPIPPGTGTTDTFYYPPNNLTPGTQYNVFIRTNCGGGVFSTWSMASFTTEAINCTSPAPLLISNIGTMNANFNWQTVSTATNYEYILNNSATPSGTPIPTTDTFYYPGTLAPGTVYYIHVRSYCGFGYYSNWLNVPFTTICPEPALPVVSNITSTSADINWAAVTGATGYQYEFSASSSPSGSGISTGGLSQPLTGLSVGTTYYFHLRTECSPGIFSSWINVSFTTVCPAPPLPSVTAITSNSATVSWPYVNGVSLYQYAVTTSSTAPASGTATAYDTAYITGLLPGTIYYLYVRSQCSPGVYSAWSPATFTTLCPSPQFIVISNVSDTAVIKWGRPMSGVNDYQYALTTDSTSPALGTPIHDTNYYTPPLASYTTYYFHVRTVCSPGVYSAWIKKSFSTGCFQPNAFVISNSATGGTAELGWYSVHGAIKYEYAVLTSAASPGGSQNYTTDTILHVASLTPGIKYYLHIRTHCSITNISEWTVLAFYVSGVAVYPNPVNGIVTIRIIGPNAGNNPIVIFDASGRRIRVIKLPGNIITVDTRGWAAGIYFVRYGNDKKYVTRMIKL